MMFVMVLLAMEVFLIGNNFVVMLDFLMTLQIHAMIWKTKKKSLELVRTRTGRIRDWSEVELVRTGTGRNRNWRKLPVNSSECMILLV